MVKIPNEIPMAFRILVIDVETTGLPKKRGAPATDVDNWPYPVQIAWVLFKCSHAGRPGRILTRKSHLIRPDGWTVPAESSAIHGITHDRAYSEGISLRDAMQDVQKHVARADAVCCHNTAFDIPVLISAGIRAGIPPPDQMIPKKPTICTMEIGKQICCIIREYSGKHGVFRKLKPPRLSELYEHIFERSFCGRLHDASEDCRATVEILDVIMQKYVRLVRVHCPSLFLVRDLQAVMS